MGWVQAGEPLHDGLLVLSVTFLTMSLHLFLELTLCLADSMPFIKGITDTISVPSGRFVNNVQVPPIDPVDVNRFEVAFNSPNLVHVILQSTTILPLHLTTTIH